MNETDRELLELAAKAAGIDGIKWNEEFPGGWLDGCGAPSTWWDPLQDDGDALRLAVKLRIEVDYYLADVQAKNDDCDPVFEMLSENADPYAATRRAIVRAAAEIGKAMK